MSIAYAAAYFNMSAGNRTLLLAIHYAEHMLVQAH